MTKQYHNYELFASKFVFKSEVHWPKKSSNYNTKKRLRKNQLSGFKLYKNVRFFISINFPCYAEYN